MALIGKRYDIVRIADGSGDIRSLEKAEATFDAMLAGKPVIYQVVLRDPENRTYGSPDLLLRADVARGLFPNCIGADEAAIAAPDLEGGLHYVVVDIKFATLALNAKGTEIANARDGAVHKAQLYIYNIYNRALGRLQGYLPECAFLLAGAGSANPRMLSITATARLTRWARCFTTAMWPDVLLSPLRWTPPRHGLGACGARAAI